MRLRTCAALATLFVAAACTQQTKDNFTNPPAGPPESCAQIASLDGCSNGSQAYSCTSDRPDDGDSDLVCSDGTKGADGATLYCCAPYGTYYTDCSVDTAIDGCVGDAFGFKCGGDTAPDEADASIVCSHAIDDGDGSKSYCCTSATIPATCARDANVSCGGIAIGYSCAGDATPSDDGAGLACETGKTTNDGTQFCCAPSP